MAGLSGDEAYALSKKHTDKVVEGIVGGDYENTLDIVKVNDGPLPIDPKDKSVNVTVPTKVSELENDSEFITGEKLSNYALASESGYELGLEIDPITYLMTLELKNKTGETLSERTIDFPLESMVIGAEYADGELTLKLQNGTTLDPINISDIVGGLVKESFTIAGIDMKDDITKEELISALGIDNKVGKDDIIDIAHGGTGQTTANEAANALINSLNTGNDVPTDDTLILTQGVGEGFENTYARRQMSKVWDWIKSKLATVATSGGYNDLTDTPEALKNPNSLKLINGTTESSYDGSKEVTVDIDVLKENGFGNLRYHNDKLQYYDEASERWIDIKEKPYTLYGFRINQGESNPENMVTYLENCDNAQFTPVHMDYTSDKFDYGTWTAENGAWFMDVKPCMLNKDGTVYKYLNPDNYAQDTEGNDVSTEITGTENEYNVMVGIPKIYWYINDNGNNTADVYISDKKLNYDKETGKITLATVGKKKGDFVCWSHIDENGNEIPYCYMPAYNGSDIDGTLRSVSGASILYSKNAQTEINMAVRNNPEGKNIWYTEVYSDRVLINLLLTLIGKSTNTEAVFGAGYNAGGSSETDLTQTGGLNGKGLFYGTQANHKIGVKVFGIEHYWGNQWRRIAGWINDNGTQKVKMTYGTSDGSTTENGYNTTGNGYITIPDSTPTGTSGNYISKMLFAEHGMIPTETSGTASTYYADGLWFDNGQVNYALVGGHCGVGSLVGAFCVSLRSAASHAWWSRGCALSCKPLA